MDTPLPPALDEYVRQRVARELIADTDRDGHCFVRSDVVLATPNDQVFGQHISPTTEPAPYYLISIHGDTEPQAIWTSQDAALRAAVDMESDQAQYFAMIHHCDTLKEVQTLVKCGADLDQLDVAGETALLNFLHPALSEDPEAEKVALYLIEQGADISIGSTVRGKHAIHLATTPQVIDALLERGASINQIDELGNTPLHDVESAAHAQLLLDRGADLNAKDQDGNTPLHYAPDRDTASLLLEHGADPAIQNRAGQTAEQFRQEGEVADFLRSTRLRHALGETASQSRPQDSDIASPDEALARRSSGRRM